MRKQVYSWSDVKVLVNLRLQDENPRTLLETLQSMIRPVRMDVIEWTTIFLLAVDLTQTELKIVFPPCLAFPYWGGHINATEWKTAAAVGVKRPPAAAEKNNFNIQTFLNKILKWQLKIGGRTILTPL